MIIIMRFSILFVISVYATAALASSTITITNGDRANFGFNDTAPMVPAGGNNARTLGQARLNAVQYTANKLSIKLNSSVAIDIFASFTPFGGDSRGAVLAGAYAPSYEQNFTSAPLTNTLYHVAIAEKISGINFNGAKPGITGYDVSIEINSDVDGAIALGRSKWYYGFDGKPTNGDIDFVTVLTHEIIHGLGFSTQMNSSSGRRNALLNDNYIANLENHGAAPANYNAMRLDSQRAAGNVAAIYDQFNAITATNLHWIGPALVAAANNNSGFQTITGHAGMYSPNPVSPGSSVSHFSRLFITPDEMMEPAYRGANHNIGFAAQVLEDVGWGRLNSNSARTDLALTITNQNANPAIGSNEVYSVMVVNKGAQAATGIIISHFLPANSDFVSFTAASTGSCSSRNVKFNKVLTCGLPRLPASGSAVFNVTVRINGAGTSEYGANVESLNPDSSWVNNNAVNVLAAVNPPPVQFAPIFNTVNDQSVTAGQTVIINLVATDNDGPKPIISLMGNKPIGSQFTANKTAGTAQFSWTTTTADIGLTQLAFTAKDGDGISGLEDNISIKLMVNAVVTTQPTPPPTVNQPTTPAGNEGNPVSNNDVPTGGCTLNKTAKFDPVLPLLILFSILFFFRQKLQFRVCKLYLG